MSDVKPTQAPTSSKPSAAPTAKVAESHAGEVARCPRVFYLHPLLAGPIAKWPERLERARALGFSHVLLPPPLATSDVRLLDDPDRPHPSVAKSGNGAQLLAEVDQVCRDAGLRWLLDVRLDAVAPGGRVAQTHSDVFHDPDPAAPLDPSVFPVARWGGNHAALVLFWTERLDEWRRLGAAGFRWSGLEALPRSAVRALTDAQRRSHGHALIVGAFAPQMTEVELRLWGGVGLDRIELAVDLWDDAAEAILRRAEAAALSAPLLAAVEVPFGRRLRARMSDPLVWQAAAARLLTVAAALGDGWMMTDGFAEGSALRLDANHQQPAPAATAPAALEAAIRDANGPMRPLGPAVALPSSAGTSGFLRRHRDLVRATVVNQGRRPVTVDPARLAPGHLGADVTLAPGQAVSLELTAAPLIKMGRGPRDRSATERAKAGRIAIEAITPSVDNGRFPAKRIAGEVLEVEADLICDGHDKLAAVVSWRPIDSQSWTDTPMLPVGNDRWRASFRLGGVGRFQFRVVAWRDAFATFRDELAKKTAAGIDVHLEIREGQALVAEAAARSPEVAKFGTPDGAALLSAPLADAMRHADARPFLTESAIHLIEADQRRAMFSSWYEIFPRSMAGDGKRHGTFKDVVRQLPRIRDMGFDVLYFPPIHPIGRVNRKGPNNSLRAGPNDPGSPYAIGGPDGGHDALHPQLGTFADFAYLVEQANKHGLALALDFAIQCAPDHPWLAQHKDWFAWRPDGSLRYAENPPKKYEDIVNVDFYAAGAVPALWVALCDVVMFWMKQGVRIIRVDNPHTKPLPFWEWLIGEVKFAYPDAIFLAEAFTRPKVMNRLGKIGFGQSYTYFTWRNTKAELQEYLTQLVGSDERDFFRPNFFVNTPDINPPFLQEGGRPAHLIRAALAATLSGNWGVYSGFELCDATPLPGREEYLDSEKYQIRAWDWQKPGNIVAEVTALNRLRRLHPALQTHLGVSFLPSSDDQVLFYEKATPDRSDVLLIAVSLDPNGDRASSIELPLWKWGLPDQATLECRDVLHETRFALTGKWQRVALSPNSPYTIWHAHPRG